MHFPSIREHFRWRGPWIVFLLFLRELLKPLLYWHIWNIYDTDLSRGIPQPYSRAILDVVFGTSRDDLSSIKPALLSMGKLSALEIDNRFHRGDVVVVASSSGQPVAYSFTLRKSFRAPLSSRFSWPGHPAPPMQPRSGG
jgi:hypothetical protein